MCDANRFYGHLIDDEKSNFQAVELCLNSRAKAVGGWWHCRFLQVQHEIFTKLLGIEYHEYVNFKHVYQYNTIPVIMTSSNLSAVHSPRLLTNSNATRPPKVARLT